MKRLISILFVITIRQTVNAQRTIDGLVKAEKDFAAYSVAHSTKEAFLNFLDSTGIIFDNGKAVNGIETWNKREKRPGILKWQPQFAEIANSNDFGYTTGPWTFQSSPNDTNVARGQYTTVWHIDKNGEWKFLIDLGVNNTQALPFAEVKKINKPKLNTKTEALPHVDPMVAAENGFIQLFAKNKSKAYKQCLSKESILSHSGFAFAIGSADQQVIIDSTPSSIRFIMDGWGGSPAQDMCYTYGTVILNSKTGNYQRIWRHEKDGWKIALEVLRY